jgi:ABC-type multidrug transport system ATPase subunit
MLPSHGLKNMFTGEVLDLAARSSAVAGRSKDADLVLTDPRCSRRQFRIVPREGGFALEALSPTCPTLCDGRPVEAPVLLKAGAVIEVPGYRFEFVAPPATAPPPAPGSATVMADVGSVSVEVLLRDHREYPLARDALVGRDPSAHVVLSHPAVSRRHALVIVTPGTVFLSDLGSANGTFVNGRRVKRRVRLRPGDRLAVGPYQFTFTGHSLAPASRHNNLELVARRLSRTVPDPLAGKPRTLLDAVSLVIRPGEFVCLLGPSGSGKSTLLSALSARVPADSGRVFLNGTDLYAEFESLKRDLVVVPQKDHHFDTLTAGQVLSFAARLRLPPDTDAGEVKAEVGRLLNAVGLQDHRHTAVSRLSGGQLKRLSLAHELIGDPSLVFLDEVTSGLDEQTDREMMALFRQLADRGKTVVCVTHSLANVEAFCHLAVVLAGGGRLAFVGKPGEAIAYFGTKRLGDVYEALERRSPEEWKAAFEADALHARYVAERLSAAPAAGGAGSRAPAERRGPLAWAAEFARQTRLLFARNAALTATDRGALAAVSAQCLLVAAVLGLVFGPIPGKPEPLDRARATLNLWFLVGVSCFWFGCNNAARVVVQDRPVYARERAYNLLPSAYLGARFGTLALLAGTQVLLLVGVVGVWCRPPGLGPSAVGLLLALAAAGTAAGLMLSAAANTEQTAVALVPLVLIPQIVLSDSFIPLDGLARQIARSLVTVYWGYRGLAAGLPDDDPAATLVSRTAFAGNLAVVLVHAACLYAAAFAILRYRDRR